MSPFGDRLTAAVHAVGAPAAVGLDPHLDRLPEELRATFTGKTGRAYRAAAAEAVLQFNQTILAAIAGRVAAVKPQVAFYEALGSHGWAALEETCALARAHGLLVIGDAKRGDISSTGRAYAHAILHPDGPLACDAITVNPWMGIDTVAPYLDICKEHGRGVFVLVRTTNPGSALLQHHGREPAAWAVATALAALGKEPALLGTSGTSAVGAVVGAQAWREAPKLREMMPHAWFLVPGIGAQGGSAAQALAGARSDGLGALPVASRSVIFPTGHGPIGDRVSQAADELVSAIRDAAT